MKLLNERHNLEKIEVMESYYIETQNDFDESLSNKEMLLEIIDKRLYHESVKGGYLHFDAQELAMLKQALEKPIIHNEDNNYTIELLRRKMFLGKESDGTYVLYEEFVDYVKKLLGSPIPDIWNDMQVINEHIKKYMNYYIVMEEDDLISLLEDIGIYVDRIMLRACLLQTYVLYLCKCGKKEEKTYVYLYSAKLHYEVMISRFEQFEIPFQPLEEGVYKRFIKFGFDYNELVESFFEKLACYYDEDSEEYSSILADFKTGVLYMAYPNMTHELMNALQISKEEKEELMEYFTFAFEGSVSPALKGRTVFQLKLAGNKDMDYLESLELYDKNDHIELFSSVIFACYDYLNCKYHALPFDNLHEMRYLSNFEKVYDQEIVDKIELLDQIDQEELYHFNPEQLEVLEGIKKVIHKDLIVGKFNGNYMFLIDENDKVYKCRAKYFRLNDRKIKLGSKINVILFPYKDMYIVSERMYVVEMKAKKSKKAIKAILENQGV